MEQSVALLVTAHIIMDGLKKKNYKNRSSSTRILCPSRCICVLRILCNNENAIKCIVVVVILCLRARCAFVRTLCCCIIIIVVDFLYNIMYFLYVIFFWNFIYDLRCPARFPIIIYSRKMPLLRTETFVRYIILYLRDRDRCNNIIYYNNNEMISLRLRRRARIMSRETAFFVFTVKTRCCVMSKVYVYVSISLLMRPNIVQLLNFIETFRRVDIGHLFLSF